MIRIAITGPECSGKTTLSKQLGDRCSIVVIPEFARTYLGFKEGTYEDLDLDIIACEQVNQWNECSQPVICDTELTVLKIWSEVKFTKTSPVIQKLYDEQQFDHYFLCEPDIPWEPDPLREHPDERDQLFVLYQEELTRMNRPFTIISGSVETRMNQCVAIINSLFPIVKKK